MSILSILTDPHLPDLPLLEHGGQTVSKRQP